jgi:peptidoglycan hydrolase CwlO-like protein
MGTSAMLESDLQRVQQKVGDLQKQRQELSMQVRQLTDRSNNLQQQIKHSPSSVTQTNQSRYKGVA